MKFVTKTLNSIWKDEEAQGTAEYVLMIVVAVSLAFIFKDKIIGLMRSKTDELSSEMGSFSVEK